MIIAETKPIKELLAMTGPCRNLLVAGCGTCVTVCYAGGEKEVAIAASLLRMSGKLKGIPLAVSEITVKRQCEQEFVEEMDEAVKEADAVLSLACAAGIQLVAERYQDKVILPGVNTLYMGVVREQGVWEERCRGCGHCRLDQTAAVCLVTNCPKGQMNAPCGFGRDGKCEVNEERECAWVAVARRLRGTKQEAAAVTFIPPHDWSLSAAGAKRINRNERMRFKDESHQK